MRPIINTQVQYFVVHNAVAGATSFSFSRSLYYYTRAPSQLLFKAVSAHVCVHIYKFIVYIYWKQFIRAFRLIIVNGIQNTFKSAITINGQRPINKLAIPHNLYFFSWPGMIPEYKIY